MDLGRFRNKILTQARYAYKINEYFYAIKNVYRKSITGRLVFTLGGILNPTERLHNLELIANVEVLSRKAHFEAILFAIKNGGHGKYFSDRFELLTYALSQVTVNGEIVEYGVARGVSLIHIAKHINLTHAGAEVSQSLVHGFDSFEGLPEDWEQPGNPKGSYALERSELEAISFPSNVRIHKGTFDQTIPSFIKEIGDNLISFLHIDSDLYTSAKIVLKMLKNKIVSGTIIVFDEYYGYHGWEKGEFKAFDEFIKSSDVKFEYIAFNIVGEQVAIRIL